MRDLPRGTPILYEAVFFVVSKGGPLPADKIADVRFQALSCPYNNPTPRQRFVVNRYWMAEDDRGDNITGLFLQASRINHSCVPNASYAWNEELQRLTVHATVDIPQNKEIFVNYNVGDYLETTIQRQQGLRKDYGFDCRCPACDFGTSFGRASDDRRNAMRDLKNDLNANGNLNQLTDRTRRYSLIKEFITLVQQEGLIYPQLAGAYFKKIVWYEKEMGLLFPNSVAAEIPSSLREKALKVARKMLDLEVACNGPQSPQVTKALTKIEDLKRL